MKQSKLAWSIGLLCAVLGIGCAAADAPSPPSAPRESDLGTVAVALSAGSSIAGYQIDVVSAAGGTPAPSTVSTSRFVAATGGAAETLFTLAPGDYVVTATPARSAGVSEDSCTPASGAVTVVRGKTASLVLVARCHAPGSGGVDVTVGTNTEPEVTEILLSPARPVAPCETLTLTAHATDADGDPISFRFSAAAAPGGTAALTLEAHGSQIAFSAAAAGDFTILVSACDALGCVTLDVPVHVAGAGAPGCAVSCDDGNPCTADSQGAGGLCAHAPVADGPLCTAAGALRVKVLGFNDFHGHLDTDLKVGARLVGGAAVLASYLQAAQLGIEDQTILVHAGDLVGASPPDSALLQDEPSIQVLDLLANPACRYADTRDPACNVVGTFGNHEFDEGRGELLRLLGGGNFPGGGPFLEDPWRGARVPYVSANVRDALTHETLVPPYVIKQVHGVPVAFVGAVLEGTPTIVTPTGVAGLEFIDEAAAINGVVPELVAQGVRSIVVTIHQGGFQASYTGPTRAGTTLTSGPEILDIVSRLDDEIDVVVSGHTHAFTNALIPNAHGKPILVTQAFSNGTAYDDIDLLIDPTTRDVVGKSAQIVTTFADAGPGLTPDPMVAAIVGAADTRVAPLVTRVVGSASVALTRAASAAGESALGDVIADAQREATGTPFAFMNPGGIRADLAAGTLTWGALFGVQPFGNSLVTMNLTGAQIYAVLEQQWLGQTAPRILQISGFDYTWDPAAPVGARVIEVRLGGAAIDRTATYAVTCNNFLSTGGDGFTAFTGGTDQVGGAIDLDALVEYVEAHSPIEAPAGARIRNP